MSRNPAASTAFGPMVLSAVEQNEPPERRLVDDDLAALFLPLPLRVFVAATRWAPLRRAVIGASERAGPGLWANIACRKHFIDDNLVRSLGDIDAVVVLGAGLDTRAYRLARDSDVPVFEVDLPINIARKRNIVARVLGALPPSVHLVPIDFERDDLYTVLAEHGYRSDARTFFVWEGVTQYLTEAATRATFAQLATAAPGSRIDFTFVRADFIAGTNLYGAQSLYRKFVKRRRTWKFGLSPEAVADFLAEYGWRLVDQLDPRELLDRYVRPADRTLQTSQIEWSVYAERV
jgi:methyltransferase (TIGR00027 family)